MCPASGGYSSALFDKRWDDQRHGKALRDSNAYSTGVIGYHNVVLVHMPNMGKVAAVTAAACLRSSFPDIQLALVVGICGGTPSGNRPSEDLLGDVIISEGLVQYDLWRQFPNNKFIRKDTPRRDLAPRSARPLPSCKPNRAAAGLRQDIGISYGIATKVGRYGTYPGAIEDRLFKSNTNINTTHL
jgi:hypothetical protein